MALVFQRADGFIICTFCGTTYSEVLHVCPECRKMEIQTPDPTLKGQYQCTQGLPCEEGGEDGICCLSCQRFERCQSPCFTAENCDPTDDVKCEFIKEVIK